MPRPRSRRWSRWSSAISTKAGARAAMPDRLNYAAARPPGHCGRAARPARARPSAARLPSGDPACESAATLRERGATRGGRLIGGCWRERGGERRHPRVPGRHARGRRAHRAGLRGIDAGKDAANAWHDALGDADRRLRGVRRRIFPRPRRPTSRTSATACSAHSPARRRGALPAGAVLAGEDLTPSRFLSADWSRRRHRASPAAAPRAMWRCSPARAACRWWSGSARSISTRTLGA